MNKNYSLNKSITKILFIVLVLFLSVAVAVCSAVSGTEKTLIVSENKVTSNSENVSTIYGADIAEYDGTVSTAVQTQFEAAQQAGRWQGAINTSYDPSSETVNEGKDGSFAKPYYIETAEQLIKVINNASSKSGSDYTDATYNTADTYFIIKNDINLGSKMYAVSDQSRALFNITGYDYTALSGYEDFATSTGFTDGGKNYSDTENPFKAIKKYLDDKNIGESVSDIQQTGNDFATIYNLYLEPEKHSNSIEVGLFNLFNASALGINIYNAYANNSVAFDNFGFFAGASMSDCYLAKINVKGATFVYGDSYRSRSIGGILGRAQDGHSVTFDSVGFEGGIIAAGIRHIGGMVGYVYTGTNLTFTGTNETYGKISAQQESGGFVGYVESGNLVFESSNTNNIDINTTNNAVGGFVGAQYEGSLSFTGSSKNLGTVRGYSYVGGYVGSLAARNVTITGGVNGYNGGAADDTLVEKYNDPNSAIEASNIYVGGFIGCLRRTEAVLSITDSHNYMVLKNVAGVAQSTGFGGIVGECEGTSATIENCINHADINNLYKTADGAQSNAVGGIVGCMRADFVIQSCKNYGDIKSHMRVGGIAGIANYNNISVKIYDSVNYGTIYATGYDAAGIFGSAYANIYPIRIERCTNYASIYVSPTMNLAGTEKQDGGVYSDEEAYDLTEYGTFNVKAGGILGYYKHLTNEVGGVYVIDCVNGEYETQNKIKVYGRNVGGIVGGNGGDAANTNFTIHLINNTNYMDIHSGGFVGGLYGYITGYTNLTIGNPSFEEGYQKIYGNFGTVYSYVGGDANISSDTGGLIGKIGGYLKLVGKNDYINDTVVDSKNTCVGGIIGYLTLTYSQPVDLCANWGNEATIYGGRQYVGGILGGYTKGNVEITGQMYNTGDVICRYGTSYIGGLIGRATSGTLTISAKVYNEGNVYSQLKTTDASYGTVSGSIGGLIGSMENNIEFTDGAAGSYNSGIIYANFRNIGGIIGNLNGTGYFSEIYSYENPLIEDGGVLDLIIYDAQDNSENISVKETIYGEACVSGFIGYGGKNAKTLVFGNCDNYATCYSTANDVGGFIGQSAYTTSLTMNNCFNYADLTSGTGYIGGLAGSHISGLDITNCGNYGDITAITGSKAGGLFAWIGGNNTVNDVITNCFNEGNVDCAQDAGGIAGQILNVNDVKIINCYNKGNVFYSRDVSSGTTTQSIGGLVGYATNVYGALTVDNCYVECEQVGNSNSMYVGGLIGNIYYTINDSSLVITNCHTDIKNIYTSRDAGAAVGSLRANSNSKTTNFTITDCYFMGETITGSVVVGGILGNVANIKNLTVKRIALLVDRIVLTRNNHSLGLIAQAIGGFSGKIDISDIYITSDAVTTSGAVSFIIRDLRFNYGSADLTFLLNNYYYSGDVSGSYNTESGAVNFNASATNLFSTFSNSVASSSYMKTFSVHNVLIKQIPSTTTFNMVGGVFENSGTGLPNFSPEITNSMEFSFGDEYDNRFVTAAQLQNIDTFENWGITKDVRSGNADTALTPWGIDPSVNGGKPFLMDILRKDIVIYYNNAGDDLDIFDNTVIRGSDEIATETVVTVITYITDTITYNQLTEGAQDYSDYEYLKKINRVGYEVTDFYKAREADGSYLEANKYTEIPKNDEYKVFTIFDDMVLYVDYVLVNYTIALDNGEEIKVVGASNNSFNLKSTGIYIENINTAESVAPFVYFALKVPSSAPAVFNAIGEDDMILISGETGTTNAVYNLYFENFINQQILYSYANETTLTFKAMFVPVYKVSFALADGTFPSYLTVTNSSGVAVSFGSVISIQEGQSETYSISIAKHYQFGPLKEDGIIVTAENSNNGYLFDDELYTITILNCTEGEEYNFEISISAIVYTINYELLNSFGDPISPSFEDVSLTYPSQEVQIGNVAGGQSIYINPSSIYTFLNYRYAYTVNGSTVYEDIDTQNSVALGSIICSSDYLDKYADSQSKTITIQILLESNVGVNISISNFTDWDDDYGYVLIYVYNSAYVLQSETILNQAYNSFDEAFDIGYIIEVVPFANQYFEITRLSLNNSDTSLSNGKITIILDRNQSLEIEMDYIKYYVSYSVIDENNNEIDGANENMTAQLESGNSYITKTGDIVTGSMGEIAGFAFNSWGVLVGDIFIPFSSDSFATDGTLNNGNIDVASLESYINEDNQIIVVCRLFTLFNINFAISDTGDNLGQFRVEIYNDTFNRFDEVDVAELEVLPFNSRIKITAMDGDYYDFIQFTGIYNEEVDAQNPLVAEFLLTESRTVLLQFQAKNIETSLTEDLSNASGQLIVSSSSGSTDTWKAGDTISFTFDGSFGQEIESFSLNGIDAKELASTYDNITYANGVLTVTLTIDFLESFNLKDFQIAVSSEIGTVYLVMLLSIIIVPIVLTVLILIFVIINVKRRKKAMEIVAQRKASMSRFEASSMVSELKKGTYQQADRNVSKEEIERQLKARKDNK